MIEEDRTHTISVTNEVCVFGRQIIHLVRWERCAGYEKTTLFKSCNPYPFTPRKAHTPFRRYAPARAIKFLLGEKA